MGDSLQFWAKKNKRKMIDEAMVGDIEKNQLLCDHQVAHENLEEIKPIKFDTDVGSMLYKKTSRMTKADMQVWCC
jgi:hypothetical protein